MPPFLGRTTFAVLLQTYEALQLWDLHKAPSHWLPTWEKVGPARTVNVLKYYM
jgi:hypothetical protein